MNAQPLSLDHAQCLALAYQLHALLGELYDKSPGAGSRIERAYDAVDDVISALGDGDGLQHCDGWVRLSKRLIL